MPGRHHTSLVVEHGGRLFWFDAGENCSYSAHLAGLDLPATEAIFLSHAHMDHIGGLPNLLWTLNKLASVSPEARQRLTGRRIEVYTPDRDSFEGMLKMLSGTEGGFKTAFKLVAKGVRDGLLFDRHGMRVTARHNLHLGSIRPYRSFSYRIDAGAKRIVYSGDVKSMADLEPLAESCDLLLMETGHHKVEEVCRWLKETGMPVGQLVFLHHGRAVLGDPEGELEKARAILGDGVRMADDGMALEL